MFTIQGNIVVIFFSVNAKKMPMKGICIMWKKIISFFFRPAAESITVPARKVRKGNKVRKVRKISYYQPPLPLE